MTDDKPDFNRVAQKHLMVDFTNFKAGFENAKVLQVNSDSGFIFTQDSELLCMVNKRIAVLAWFNPTGYTDDELLEKANNLVPAFLKQLA